MFRTLVNILSKCIGRRNLRNFKIYSTLRYSNLNRFDSLSSSRFLITNTLFLDVLRLRLCTRKRLCPSCDSWLIFSCAAFSEWSVSSVVEHAAHPFCVFALKIHWQSCGTAANSKPRPQNPKPKNQKTEPLIFIYGIYYPMNKCATIRDDASRESMYAT